MTNNEICTSYREAGCTPTQIEILADLNDCLMEEIVNVLADGGYKIANKFQFLLADEQLLINGNRYNRPLTMSRTEWYKYKKRIQEMQTEKEYYQCEIKALDNILSEEEEYLRLETWKGEWENCS